MLIEVTISNYTNNATILTTRRANIDVLIDNLTLRIKRISFLIKDS